MDKINVSVIVPIFNGEKFIVDCYTQLIQQTLNDIEIILVDDGSSDKTFELCNDIVKKYSFIRVFRQENAGVSAARNCGLKHAKGKYVGFVDVDDQYDNDMYECLFKIAEKYDADIACLDVVGKPEQVTVWYNNADAIKELLKNNINMSSCNKIYKREAFPNMNFCTEYRINEDFWTVYNLLKSSTCITCMNKNKYHYIHREGSVSRTRVFEKKYFDAITVSNLIYNDVLVNYPNLSFTAKMKRMDTYLRISKIYYLRGKPKEFLPEIKHIKSVLKKLTVHEVIHNMKVTNVIRYYTYLYCFPLFYLLIKTIDKK